MNINFEDLDKHNKLINQEPPHSEESEDGNYRFIPIAYLEEDLRDVYKGAVQFQIISQSSAFGFWNTHVRIKAYVWPLNTWLDYDGTSSINIESVQPGQYVGSSKVQVAIDLKLGNPIGYSEAIQNAAKRIGNRFGSNLNREKAPGKAAKVTAYEVIEKPVFDPKANYTKKQLLQMISLSVITADIMNAYLKGEPINLEAEQAAAPWEQQAEQTTEQAPAPTPAKKTSKPKTTTKKAKA